MMDAQNYLKLAKLFNLRLKANIDIQLRNVDDIDGYLKIRKHGMCPCIVI